VNIALVASGPLKSKKEATWITITDLARSYVKRGHNVFICAQKHKNFPKIENLNGFSIYRLFSNKYLKFITGYRTVKEISKKLNVNFDVIHGFSSNPIMILNTYLASKISKNIKPKTIHTIKSYPLSKFQGRFFSKFSRLVDHLTTSTKTTSDRINKNSGSSNITVIRSNINLEKFQPKNKNQLKSKYGHDDKKIILYYGAMRIQKGVDYLLKSLPGVIDKNKNVICILAFRSCSKKNKEKYRNMIKELQIRNNIVITLEKIKIEDYVAMADVVVLAYPSLIGTEGNPSCLLEAMASKTKVVTTNLPELKEIIENQKEVIMAKPEDINSLTNKINYALNNNLNEMIDNAYKKSKEFDVKKISAQFLKLYHQ